MFNDDKPEHKTAEQLKALVGAGVETLKSKEAARAMKVAQRIQRKLYAGRFTFDSIGNVRVWVWVWDSDATYAAAQALGRALNDLFKESGLYVIGFSPGLFSITVVFGGLLNEQRPG